MRSSIASTSWVQLLAGVMVSHHDPGWVMRYTRSDVLLVANNVTVGVDGMPEPIVLLEKIFCVMV